MTSDSLSLFALFFFFNRLEGVLEFESCKEKINKINHAIIMFVNVFELTLNRKDILLSRTTNLWKIDT